MVGFRYASDSSPSKDTIEAIVRPTLTCLLDADSRVRYYACESLYNITKVARADILPMFEAIFDSLTKIVADPDVGVRSGAEHLDKLLKDIIVEQQSYDVQNFFPKFEEYIYAKNPFTRMFIISWIRLLDSKFNMVNHLPQLLDGIYTCLYDSSDEIKSSTLSSLSEFLNKIVASPTDQINIPALINILLKHIRNEHEDVVQYNALAWLRQLIRLLEDQDILNFAPSIIAAVLPCLAIQATPDGSISSNRENFNSFHPKSSSRYNICEISCLVNSLVLDEVTRILTDRKKTQPNESALVDLEPILEVLVKELQKREHPVIKLAILDWLKKLKNAEPTLMLGPSLHQKLFQIILETLSDRSDAVVKSALRVIADIFCCEQNKDSKDQQVARPPSPLDTASIEDCHIQESDKVLAVSTRRPGSSSRVGSILNRGASTTNSSPFAIGKKVAISATPVADLQSAGSGNANISKFILSLYNTFRDKETVFEERGTFIILNLCSIIKPSIIYKSFADILIEEKNEAKFAYNLVQKLNQILLTTQPLFGLRYSLSNDDDPKVKSLFQQLFQAWNHSSTAVLTLCLLTNNYKQASEIVTRMSLSDINLDTLTQIDWIVQLIESPVFASLRMRLLDSNNNHYLLHSLYGLMMILPQSDAFKKLGNRLDQAYKYTCMQSQFNNSLTTRTSASSHNPTSLSNKQGFAPGGSNVCSAGSIGTGGSVGGGGSGSGLGSGGCIKESKKSNISGV